MLTVLVTGATSGFGAAFARRFIRDGHRVIATGRRVERLTGLAAELGERLLPAALDVTDAAAVAGFLNKLPEGWRAPDVLINNAGLAVGASPAWETKNRRLGQDDRHQRHRLVHVTHAVLPGMVAPQPRHHHQQARRAHPLYPYPGGHVYGASKAFVKQFSLNLRADLIGKNIRVTDLEPGIGGRQRVQRGAVRQPGKGGRGLRRHHAAEPGGYRRGRRLGWALPAHMNVNRMELMPTCQASGPLAIKRES